MNHRILPLLLAIIAGAAILTSCASAQKTDAGEAVNRVHPIGEGNYYDPSAADGQGGTQAATEPSTVPPTTEKKKKTQATTAPSTAPTTAPSSTVPATTNANVPKDNMTPSHINPSLGLIQSEVYAELQALALKKIALSKTAVTLEVGEKESLELQFTPSDAPRKTCTVKTSNKNATALFVDKKLVITGKAAGTCTVTVTSFNNLTATCEVTVKAKEVPATEAATEAQTEAETEPEKNNPEENNLGE